MCINSEVRSVGISARSTDFALCSHLLSALARPSLAGTSSDMPGDQVAGYKLAVQGIGVSLEGLQCLRRALPALLDVRAAAVAVCGACVHLQ